MAVERLKTPAPASTATDAGARAAPAAVAVPPPPLWLGPYRLLHLLGEGGMGQVWLAQQEEPVQRKVGVKVIKAGMDTRQVVARFESERQALALMSHPAIAQVFDGGSTPEGRPYFVMEYVEGSSITAHCDQEQLPVEARLALLVEVCAGVQHAHQKAVIHRDLKPSNILVAHDGAGRAQPKIIDFGVAKALGPPLTDSTLQTLAGAVVGTPGYMSPEQADPAGDVDTRTDVYSLGVILYELLTGELPFTSRPLRTPDVDPPRPSNRAVTAELASSRRTDPAHLRRLLKGDLDAVTMKALEKDRARRYGTPSELAADLGRYLRDEPVLAQPPSAAYRARKYVQRNKLLVGGVLALIAVLAAGVVASALQARRARLAERNAESEAAVAKATSEFLQKDLLGQADVAQQQGKADPDLKVRTVLDRAAARIEGKFNGQPAVEASIRGTIGQAYRGLGLYPEAHQHLERALDLNQKALGAGNAESLAAAAALAGLSIDEGKYPEAEALLQETLTGQERVLGPEHPDTLRTLVALGAAKYSQGKRPESQALFARALELQRRVLGPEHRETLNTMRALANTYTINNQPAAAEPLYREALEAQRRLLGPEHPDTVSTLSALGTFLSNFSRPAEAAPLLEELLPIARRLWGREHPKTLDVLGTLVSVDTALGKFAGAEAAALEVLEIRSRVLGPEHPRTLNTLSQLGGVYHAWGRYPQAEATFRQALDGLNRVRGPESVVALDAAEGLARAEEEQGKLAAAASRLEKIVEVRRRTQGAEYRDTLLSVGQLAWIRAEQGRLAEAEALQAGLLEPMARVQGAESSRALSARVALAQFRCWEGDYARAAPLFAEVSAAARRALGPEHRTTLWALQARGTCLAREGKHEQAAAVLGEALAGFRTALGPENPTTLEAGVDLSLALQAQGKLAEAEALARTAFAGSRQVRPGSWQTGFAGSVLGACLAAEHKRAEAAPLLRAGLRALEAQQELIPAPERFRLELARKWLGHGGAHDP